VETIEDTEHDNKCHRGNSNAHNGYKRYQVDYVGTLLGKEIPSGDIEWKRRHKTYPIPPQGRVFYIVKNAPIDFLYKFSG
jgi:hypothetical protein